jgi:hypothetical protein
MITQSEIARKDFDRVCELNNYEVFTEKQVSSLTNHIKGIIEKSNRETLTPTEIQSIHAYKEDMPELKKAIVLNNDLSRELLYYRERKVIFDDVIEKSEDGEITKARTGTYANTAQNRKLGRVGRKYDPRDKKAEEESKGKTEGKKEETKEELLSKMNKMVFDKYGKDGSNVTHNKASKEIPGYKDIYEKYKEGGEKKEEGGYDAKEWVHTNPKKILELTKELNSLKAKRSQFIEDSYAYKVHDKKIKDLESRRITDKDGNTTGWEKADDED